MFLFPLSKTQLDFKYLWAKAVFSMYLKKELEKKAVSYTGTVAQQDFSLCLQVLTELGLTMSGFSSTNYLIFC